jgi:hypothetical protein
MKKMLTVIGVIMVALAVGLGINLAHSSAAAPRSTPNPASVTAVDPTPSDTAGPQQPPAAADDEKTGEQAEAPGSEQAGGSAAEGDTHEDPAGQNVDHQCPPDCDTANGEKP